jgi:hypothetical protein
MSERYEIVTGFLACSLFLALLGRVGWMLRVAVREKRERNRELDAEIRKTCGASKVLIHDSEGRPFGFRPIRVVELRMAFAFTCEECGRDSFARAIVPESLEGILPEGLDPEEFESGEWVMKPDSVTCSHCGLMFETEEG